MTTITATQDIPLPVGAVRVYDWGPPEVTGYPEAARYFVGTSHRVDIDRGEHIEIAVDGTQWSGDGRVERYDDYPTPGHH
jgi:hypothetical protein